MESNQIISLEKYPSVFLVWANNHHSMIGKSMDNSSGAKCIAQVKGMDLSYVPISAKTGTERRQKKVSKESDNKIAMIRRMQL